MKTYEVFYYDQEGELVDQTNIDEFSFDLAVELMKEFKIEKKVWKIEMMEVEDE